MSGPHDIFICHDHASAASVKRLTAALASRGVSSFAYEAGSGSDLQPKLATSKCFLVWGSEGFFQSRGCQTHLVMASLAGARETQNLASRILVVNAQTGLKHIYPLHLRSLIIAAAPGQEGAPDYTGLAELLHQHCAPLNGTLGGLYPIEHAVWTEPYDKVLHPPLHFAGRERELWDIHAALTRTQPHKTGFAIDRCAVVSGASGLGKSCLAREYAFRFGPAYPGGIFRLSASEAQAAARLRDLAQNPSLQPQLLALLKQRCPDTTCRDDSPLSTVQAELRSHLAEQPHPYLWIVDDLPDGINGPVLRQWLAPTAEGHNLLITRSQGYDHRAEPIHLPLLDETAGTLVITQGRPPTRNDELDAARWLSDEVGRHPLYAAMVAALAEHQRGSRRATFGWLLNKFDRKNKPASELARLWPAYFPESRETPCAAVLLESLKSLEGPARDILRLGAELAEHPLPLEFIVDCLLAGNMSADDRKEDLFTIFLNEPQEIPLTPDAARDYVEKGAAGLERQALAIRTDRGLTLQPIAVKALNQVVNRSPRQTLLRDAALQVMYVMAEACLASHDWQRLAAMAPHGHKLVSDLRERIIEEEDSPAEITGRIRLALHLADLDLAQGARLRALAQYRAASSYLVRAMAVDTHNSARQRDFARVQEQLGDLLAQQEDPGLALDHYRKSLGIRAFMAKQDTPGMERCHDPLRLHTKIRDVQKRTNDLEGALQSEQAAHLLHARLAQQAEDDIGLAFNLANSHTELAELHIALNQTDAAMTELEHARPIFERLAEAHPDQVRFVRAPAQIHNRIGDILAARDDLSGALNRYRTALAIAEHAARLDPTEPEWQRDLAICHNHLGDTLTGLDDTAEADSHYLAFLDIAEQAANQSAFAGLRGRDIAAVRIKLGRSCEIAKDLDASLRHYQLARLTIEKLAIEWPELLKLRDDLGWLRNRIERLNERREAELRRQARLQARP